MQIKRLTAAVWVTIKGWPCSGPRRASRSACTRPPGHAPAYSSPMNWWASPSRTGRTTFA